MKIRVPIGLLPILSGIGMALGLAISFSGDPTAEFDLLEWLLAPAAFTGLFALIALLSLAIPFAKVDERGFWYFVKGQGMLLIRPLGHGERFVVADARLWIQRSDGERERMRLARRQTSRKTWALLEAAYPVPDNVTEPAD
jgi:hypothetical protein